MPANQFPFGRDEYEYRDGERYSTASGITLRPLDGEDTALFQQRTDHWCKEFTKLPDVRSVTLRYEWRKGVIVQALIMTYHLPRLAPLEAELEYGEIRAVGGRVHPRGRRGGKKAA
jgi:hypothetical protein